MIELTPRQQDIINLLIEGYSNREIGSELKLGERTVKQHMNRLFMLHGIQRSGIDSRVVLGVMYYRKRLCEQSINQPTTDTEHLLPENLPHKKNQSSVTFTKDLPTKSSLTNSIPVPTSLSVNVVEYSTRQEPTQDSKQPCGTNLSMYMPKEPDPRIIPLDTVVKNHALEAIRICKGNIPKAAFCLGIGQTTLYRWITTEYLKGNYEKNNSVVVSNAMQPSTSTNI